MRKPNAKERILEVAGDLFCRRGYSEVGINEIIEKAETAKASFYQHFKSKECLCEVWLQTVHERSEQRRCALLGGSGTPAEKAASYFDDLRDYLIESEYRGCPYSNTGSVVEDPEGRIARSIRAHKQATRAFFQRLCEQRFGLGDEARKVGDRLFLLYSGAAVEAQNLRSLWPVETAKAAATESLQ